MKSFIRENPTIAFGLGLPLLLIVLFLIVSGLPALFVPPPQYDVLYTTGSPYNYRDTAQISVVDQKVQVIQHGDNEDYRWPQLWRYNSKTGAVKEIPIIWSPSAAKGNNQQATNSPADQSKVLDVPELAGLKVDSSSIAPDGYEFRAGSSRSSNVFGELFYSSRYKSEAVLVKNGRRVRLPDRDDRYYNNLNFIGWVIEP